MKNKYLLLISTILLLLSSCERDRKESSDSIPKEKVLHYEFANNLNDISGNNFNAINDTAIDFVPDRFSRLNQAIRFNGPLHKSNFLLPVLGSKQISKRFTISFWFTITTANSTNLLFKSDYNNSVESGVSILTSNGKLRLVVGDGANNFREYDATTAISNNTWHHFAISVDSTEHKIYFNGQLYNGQMSIQNNGNYVSHGFMGNAALAKGLLGGLQPYPLTNGKMDDFRLYNYPLTTTEILAIYNYTP
jgi:Concanavalin A-like lectin/glucanases superfamily